MKLPPHVNPSPERTASAPYNFVPLPEIVVPAVKDPDNELPDQDRFHSNLKTGYFEVELEAKAPLYVRCALPVPDFSRSESEQEKQRPFRERAKNTPDFFYTQDPKHPVIPGSSLRGMLRNLLEVVSYGKVAEVTSAQKIFFRAVAAESEDPLKQPYVNVIGNMAKNVSVGYLIKHGDQWKIRPAQTLDSLKWKNDTKREEKHKRWRTEKDHFKILEEDIPAGRISNLKRLNEPDYRPQYHEVFFELEQETKWIFNKRSNKKIAVDAVKLLAISDADTGLTNAGCLVCTGNMLETGDENQKSPRRYFMIVPPPKTSTSLKKINEQAVRDYLDALTDFQKEEPPFDKQMGVLKDGRPVFYVDEPGDEIFYFGHSPNFRIPAMFETEKRAATPNDFVPAYCKEPKTLDFAEALFGHAKGPEGGAKPGDKAYAYASRVFVTDASLREGQTEVGLGKNAIVPRILASPKPTAFQHYLVQSDPNNRRKLFHYGSKKHETVIRGHKLYWHHGKEQNASATSWEETIGEDPKVVSALSKDDTQHTHFKPVKPKTQFSFRVYFENLLEAELGALCWILHPLGEAKQEYCHHLGMGKPLGMGSVKLSAKLVLTDRAARYKALFDGTNFETGKKGEAERLVDRATLEKLVKPFEEKLLRELQPDRPCEHLFQMQRIGMLLRMMEWPGFPALLPAAPENRVLQDRPNTRYMTIRFEDANISADKRNEYRDRPVLPNPSAFGGPIDGATPTAKPPSEPNGPGPHLDERQHATPVQISRTSRPQSPRTAVATPPSSPSSIGPVLPAIPITKSPTLVAAKRETVTIIKIIKGGKAQVKLESGDEVVCTGVTSHRQPQPGETFRADVKRENGKVISAVFKGWK